MNKLKKCKNGKCSTGFIATLKERAKMYISLRKDLKELKELKQNRLWLEETLQIVNEDKLKDEKLKPKKPSYADKDDNKKYLSKVYKKLNEKIDKLENKISKIVADKEINKDKNIPKDIKDELLSFL